MNQTTPLRADLLAIAELVSAGERVLDLGCGDGTLLRYLVKVRHITGRGVELLEEGVLTCVRRGLSVRQGDLHEGLGDYPDRSFDTVILSQTLPFLDDPAFICKEMLRVGERAIVSFPNWGHWRCRLDFLFSGRLPTPPGFAHAWDTAPRARPLTIRDFRLFCARHRFEIKNRVYLQGTSCISTNGAQNFWADTAIFELRRGW